MAINNIITILDDFEGAMIGTYSVKDSNIFTSLKKEKPTLGFNKKKYDYNLHFHFGINNKSNSEILIKIFIGCKEEKELNLNIPRLWTSIDINQEYELIEDIDGKTDFHGKYHFKLKLKPKQILYIANFPPIRYSKLIKKIQDLSKATNAKEVSIGATAQNKSIVSYEYGDINIKPTILLVSGFHPPERDSLSIEAIMSKFLDEKWKKEILKHYSFSLIPILNPDGFFYAMQGSNNNEVNFHWRFFGNTKKECPEAHYIWDYCLDIKPIVFFDFHAFTFQNNTARPYLIPDGYLIGRKARHAQKDLNEELKKLCNNKYSISEKILAPNLLSSGLRQKFNTISSPKFHLHMKNGIKNSRKMAVECLEIILNILKKHKITSNSDILKEPFGNVKTHIFDKIRLGFLNLWYHKIRFFIKNYLIK